MVMAQELAAALMFCVPIWVIMTRPSFLNHLSRPAPLFHHCLSSFSSLFLLSQSAPVSFSGSVLLALLLTYSALALSYSTVSVSVAGWNDCRPGTFGEMVYWTPGHCSRTTARRRLQYLPWRQRLTSAVVRPGWRRLWAKYTKHQQTVTHQSTYPVSCNNE